MAVDQARQRRQPGRQAPTRPGEQAQPVSREERLRSLADQLRRLPPERIAELEEALAALRGPSADDDRMIAVFELGARSAQHEADLADDDVDQQVEMAWREGYAEGVRVGGRLADDLEDAERAAADLEQRLRDAQERVSELQMQLAEVEGREKELKLRGQQEEPRQRENGDDAREQVDATRPPVQVVPTSPGR